MWWLDTESPATKSPDARFNGTIPSVPENAHANEIKNLRSQIDDLISQLQLREEHFSRKLANVQDTQWAVEIDCLLALDVQRQATDHWASKYELVLGTNSELLTQLAQQTDEAQRLEHRLTQEIELQRSRITSLETQSQTREAILAQQLRLAHDAQWSAETMHAQELEQREQTIAELIAKTELHQGTVCEFETLVEQLRAEATQTEQRHEAELRGQRIQIENLELQSQSRDAFIAMQLTQAQNAHCMAETRHAQEIEECHRKIADLTSQVESQQELISQLQSQIIQRNVEARQTEQRFSETIDLQRLQIGRLESRHSTRENQLNQQLSQIESYEEANSELHAQLVQQTEEARVAKQRHAETNATLEMTRARVAELESQVQSQHASIEEQSIRFEVALRNAEAQLAQSLEQQRLATVNWKAEIESWQNTNSNLHAQLVQQTEEVQEANRQRSETLTTLESTLSRLAELEDQASSKQASFEDQLKRREGVLRTAEAQLTESREQHALAMEHWKAEIESCQKVNSNLHAQLVQQTEEAQQANRQRSETLTTLETTLARLAELEDQASSNQASSEDQLKRHEVALRTAEEQLAESRELHTLAMEHWKAEIESCQKVNSKLHAQLVQQTEEAQETKRQQTETLETLETTLARLAELEDQASSNQASFEDQLKRHEGALRTAEAQLAESRELHALAMEHWKAEIESCQKVNSKLHAQLVQQTEEAQETKRQQTETLETLELRLYRIAELEARVHSQQATFDERFNQSQSALLTAQRQLANAVDQHIFAKADWKAEIELYQERVSKLEAQSIEQFERAQQLECQVICLKRLLAQNERTIEELQCALADEKLTGKNVEADLARDNHAIAQLKEQATKLEIRLQREAAACRKAQAALRRATETAEANSVASTALLQIDAEERVNRLQQELSSTKQLSLSLQRQAIAKIKSGQEEIHRLKSQLNQLQSQSKTELSVRDAA